MTTSVISYSLQSMHGLFEGFVFEKSMNITSISTLTLKIIIYVMVSPLPPPVDLSAPRVLLRPLALVTLSHDVVKVCGTGNVVCKQWLPGS